MHKKILLLVSIVLLSFFLGLFTTAEYVRALGLSYLEQDGGQLERHLSVINGCAGNPWQYRILASYLVNFVIKFFEYLKIPHHVALAFIFFRVMQDTAILVIAFFYYKKIGLSSICSIVGMALLAWGISYSHYHSDFQFNTFFDIIFYLLAGICILEKKFIWIIPITFLAALNRETSGLIPLLVFFVAIFAVPKESSKKVFFISIISLFIYIFVFLH